MQKVSPFLWYDNQAQEAAEFYCSVFKDSEILEITHVIVEAPSGPPVGGVSTVRFTIHGEELTALNGGPMFQFNPAISFVVNCADQAEVDDYWAKLTADGGEEVQCGWLTDKYGLSWQIVPEAMYALVTSSDVEAAKRATAEMLSQIKLDMAAMQRAYDNV